MDDMEQYLRIGARNNIWWTLRDAARLAAGFVPKPGSKSGAEPQLVPLHKGSLAVESLLIRSVKKTLGTLQPPEVWMIQGEEVLAAEEFLSWLGQFILESGRTIEFPADLARAVARALAAIRKQPPYESLVALLETHFDKPFLDLPSPAIEAVRSKMNLIPWDELGPERRRAYAEQCDLKADPARMGEHAFWERYVLRELELKAGLERWERSSDTVDMTAKEAAIQTLNTQLADLREGLHLVPDLLTIKRQPIHSVTQAPTKIAPYPRAYKLLFDRLNAATHEIAMWVWLGPESGGLTVYPKPDGENAPKPVKLDFSGVTNFIAPIVGCWFDLDELRSFQPEKRFIRYAELVTHWQGKPGLEVDGAVDAFIQTQVREETLFDLHPATGLTRLSMPGRLELAPWDEAIFDRSEVANIDAIHFGLDLEEDGEQEIRSIGKSVPAWKVMQAFPVLFTEARNSIWWRARFRNAKRYELAQCRATKGVPGQGDSSFWHPDLVAAWLIDKRHMDRAKVVAALRTHFPDYAESAERLSDSD